VELTRTMALEAEYWPTIDPSLAEGSREQKLDAYRDVRDQLRQRLLARFGSLGAGGV
jgi:protein-tyrosine-phosphatase